MNDSLKKKMSSLTEEDRNRLIRMCWEDRTPFEAIKAQFNIGPNEVVKCMQSLLDKKDFLRWRIRANNQGHLKHLKLRPKEVNRFKCSRQNLDGSTKGYK